MSICLHSGAGVVERDEIANVVTPARTDSHVPVPHDYFLDRVENILQRSGYQIGETKYGLSHEGQRFFGLLNLISDTEDYNLTVGVRNSHDKSVSAGFAIGTRVFVCDNLAFSGDITVARKHTTNVFRDLVPNIAAAVRRIRDFQVDQDYQITAYKSHQLSANEARGLIIDMVRSKIIPNANVIHVVDQYENPPHECFQGRNLWSLFNAVTEVGKRWSSDLVVQRTEGLHNMFNQLVAA